MNFIVYSKPNCPYCDKIKTILGNLSESRGFAIVFYELDNDFTREEFYKEFGEGSTFPQVVYENMNLGGCKDTIEYLQEQNIL